MSQKEQVPYWEYADFFKLEAVKLADLVGGNEAVKRLSIANSSIRDWARFKQASKLQS